MNDKHQEKTPRKALADFLNCWKKRDFKGMIEFVQITWKSEHKKRGDKPDRILKDFFGFKKLMFFEIKTESSQGVFADIEAVIKYSHSKGAFIKKIKPRIICETGPYQPSEEGTWGVNPISVLREF